VWPFDPALDAAHGKAASPHLVHVVFGKSLSGKTPAMAAQLTDRVWTVAELLSAQI